MDTIRVFICGDFHKKEQYLFLYNNEKVRFMTLRNFDVDSFDLYVDTTVVKNYTYLPLNVLKTNVRSRFYSDTRLSVIYEKGKKVLMIERDRRVKDKFAVSYRWLDKKRDVGISPHLYIKYFYPTSK